MFRKATLIMILWLAAASCALAGEFAHMGFGQDGTMIISDGARQIVLKDDELAEFEDAEIFLEFSAAEDEAEVVIEVEAGDAGLRTLLVISPQGRIVARFNAPVPGYREFYLESPESGLDAITAAYPEGSYLLVGTSTARDQLVGLVELSHELPEAPAILTPPADSTVSPDEDLVISWEPVDGADDYIVELELVEEDEGEGNGEGEGDGEGEEGDEGLDVELAFEVSADITAITIPAALLSPGSTYEVSVAVEGEDNDNLTEVETEFATEG